MGNSFTKWLDGKFHISARNSKISTEVNGGVAAFMAMVYIIPVSSGMYLAANVNSTAAGVAIALVTCIASVLMGWFVNIPISLSTGMGINAFAVFAICLGMGYPYDLVMLCTLIEGIIFLILSFTGARSALAMSLPHNLKMCIGGGIGFFLINIGWQNTKFIVGDESTLTTMVSFRESFSTQGITAILAVIGFLVMGILTVKKVKSAIVIGIVMTWMLGIICQLAGIYVPNPDTGYYSLYPSLGVTNPFAVGNIMINFSAITLSWSMIGDIVIITLTMFYSDFFDTLGTCITCIEKIKAQMASEIEGFKKAKRDIAEIKRLEREIKELEGEKTMKLALIIDAIGTIIGALMRCTTVTSFVESGAAIESGARTGLSSIITGLLFFLAIFFASVFTSVPGFATGPALVVVGISMIITAIEQIDFSGGKTNELIAGIACIAATGYTYNIANGMAVGVISYTVLTAFSKNRKEVRPVLYVLSVLLVAKFAFL